MDKRKKKLPHNAFRFYANMYFKRKASKETKYCSQWTEAHKSWLSLSESERQLFQEKYNEYKVKHHGNRLKEVIPFMKMKKGVRRLKRISSNSSTQSNEKCKEPEMITVTSQAEQNEQEHIPTTFQVESEEIIPKNDDKLPENDIQTNTDSIVQPELDYDERESTPSGRPTPEPVPVAPEHQTETLSEPAPPNIKTGKELYGMLNSMDENFHASWAALPKSEKNRYIRAVYLLKKDYITKYKKYLESLTPRDLFEYYNKTIF